jgi:hypothetical protein
MEWNKKEGRSSEMRRANEKRMRKVVETMKVEAGKSKNGGGTKNEGYGGKVRGRRKEERKACEKEGRRWKLSGGRKIEGSRCKKGG